MRTGNELELIGSLLLWRGKLCNNYVWLKDFAILSTVLPPSVKSDSSRDPFRGPKLKKQTKTLEGKMHSRNGWIFLKLWYNKSTRAIHEKNKIIYARQVLRISLNFNVLFNLFETLEIYTVKNLVQKMAFLMFYN